MQFFFIQRRRLNREGFAAKKIIKEKLHQTFWRGYTALSENKRREIVYINSSNF